MKVLVLGHGWRMWNVRHEPRCAPMPLDEWNVLVQDAPKESLTFLDFDLQEEPDIHENIGNDWKRHIKEASSYDVVIDAVSHLATGFRMSKYYWESVKYALKEDGVYFGWSDMPSANTKHVQVKKCDIDAHVKKTYQDMKTPNKRYKTLQQMMC
jgi:hypothetical protein